MLCHDQAMKKVKYKKQGYGDYVKLFK